MKVLLHLGKIAIEYPDLVMYSHRASASASAVADPGFPRGGGANSPGGRQHTILPYFPKNCMKLKEFGSGGGARPKFYYVDPPLISVDTQNGYHGFTVVIFRWSDACKDA